MDIEGFVNNINRDGLSSATITTYRKRLSHLANWLHHQNLDIQHLDLTEFQAYCDEQNWSNATRNLVAAVVRHYARGMLDRTNPLCRLRIPVIPPRTQKYLDADQIRALLDACSGDAPDERRARAAICLMVDAGLHSGAVCSTLVDQVDLDAMEVSLTGKTAFRAAWFSPFTARSIREWLDVRPNSQSNHLFFGSPQMANLRAFAPHVVRLMVNEVGRRAGIAVTPNVLRTTYIRMVSEHKLSAGAMQWALRRHIAEIAGCPLTTTLINEIRTALPFADWQQNSEGT